MIDLISPASETGICYRGIMESWSGPSCTVSISIMEGRGLPRRGDGAYVVAYRPDGVYRILGNVKAAEVVDAPSAGKAGTASVELEVRRGAATRIQRRSFFRMPGSWKAEVQVGTRRDGTAKVVETRVFDVSAGGFLIQDVSGDLAKGLRFGVVLELDDGEEPIRASAEVVRHDERSRGGTDLWGCRFVGLDPALETRIIRHLHKLFRERMMGRRRKSTARRSG